MGQTIWAKCYSHEDVDPEPARSGILSIRGKSLFAPRAEHIDVLVEDLAPLAPRIVGYRAIAICRAKISTSINPRLAITVFVIRMRTLFQRHRDDVRIFIEDDGFHGEGERSPPMDVASVTRLDVASMLALSIIEAPLSLLFWAFRYFV